MACSCCCSIPLTYLIVSATTQKYPPLHHFLQVRERVRDESLNSDSAVTQCNRNYTETAPCFFCCCCCINGHIERQPAIFTTAFQQECNSTARRWQEWNSKVFLFLSVCGSVKWKRRRDEIRNVAATSYFTTFERGKGNRKS